MCLSLSALIYDWLHFQFWFHSTFDGSGRGAAIAAAVAERRKKDKQQSDEEVPNTEQTTEEKEEKGMEEEKQDSKGKENVEKGEQEDSKT